MGSFGITWLFLRVYYMVYNICFKLHIYKLHTV